MDLTTIDNWNTGALDTMADSLGKRVTTVGEVEEALRTAGQLPGWYGGGADSARQLYAVTADDLRDEAAVLGAARQLAIETSSAVNHLKGRLAALRAQAAGAQMTIRDDGSVTAAATPDPEDDDTREAVRKSLETAAKALIVQAADIDGDAERVFDAIRDGRITANGAGSVDEAMRAGVEQGGLTPLEPPADKSAYEVKAYWDALSPEQQRQLLADRPELLGNVDGIPSAVRHEANVAQLAPVLKQLQDRRDQLKEQIEFWGLFTNEDAELEQVEKKIKDVEKLQQLISSNRWASDNPDGRMLLVMDMFSGEQGKAAISLGNPDDAEHVSVTTPGLDTSIRNSFEPMLGESEELRRVAIAQLDGAGRGGEKVATISWLGYEPPDKDSSRPMGVSYLEVIQQDRASAGAPDLADFYRAIDATSTKDDPHIVALGHSYGSLTQGLALQAEGGHPVDDAVFYGSPGFEADDEPELGLEDGHGYVMMGTSDFIDDFGSKGDVGPNGPAPTSTKLEQLDVNGRVTQDGVEREGAYIHSDYPRNGANGELRVSGYLMARLLAGLTPE
ncbi:alpha/beta hydrolase [Gordonia amicalis]|uniref:alpha/beta hydrolase n=1 Tax=Gordonia amicalis TaxID=89053 RepID=UPI0022A69007|nr:alpha/beta hydrolase [Gordonia amicalis]MCZ0911109.1 alpha/beta hydrolase [Gordonia amicalis]